MASKVIIELLSGVLDPSGEIREIATTAFDSGILYVEAPASNPGPIAFDFVEMHPVDGATSLTVGTPGSGNFAPGTRSRVRISDLAGTRYRFNAYPQTTNSVSVTATFVGIVSS